MTTENTPPPDDTDVPLQTARDLSPEARSLLEVSSTIPVTKQCGGQCNCDC